LKKTVAEKSEQGWRKERSVKGSSSTVARQEFLWTAGKYLGVAGMLIEVKRKSEGKEKKEVTVLGHILSKWPSREDGDPQKAGKKKNLGVFSNRKAKTKWGGDTQQRSRVFMDGVAIRWGNHQGGPGRAVESKDKILLVKGRSFIVVSHVKKVPKCLLKAEKKKFKIGFRGGGKGMKVKRENVKGIGKLVF